MISMIKAEGSKKKEEFFKSLDVPYASYVNMK